MGEASRYQLILFDLDGTLTDPKPGITRAVAHALAHYGIAVADLDALISFIGPPLHHSFARYYGFDDRQAREAVTYYREYFAEIGLYENTVYSGIPELLDRLQTAGRRLIVATSKPTVYARRILEHFQLAAYFTQVVGSELDLSRTDKAQIIGDVLNEYSDMAREAVVMVGDREHDIIGARAHDLDAIGVTYGYGSLAELRAAGATAIAESVAKLGGLLV
ncbi:MAG TPA: HAD family hydrolase [Ktedonobacterales bacterium]|nr:HAD family hydrolase [Ktedonobacterales bacterium]